MTNQDTVQEVLSKQFIHDIINLHCDDLDGNTDSNSTGELFCFAGTYMQLLLSTIADIEEANTQLEIVLLHR